MEGGTLPLTILELSKRNYCSALPNIWCFSIKPQLHYQKSHFSICLLFNIAVNGALLHRHHWFTFSVCCPELNMLSSQNALHTRKAAIIIICTDRAGPDSVRQGWELGTGHCRDVQGRVRQRKTGLSNVEKCRTGPNRTARSQ